MPVATSRLNSWKEIAAYLSCDVSTAQRWERERALPVRRVPGGKRQSVFAVSDELDAWLTSAGPVPRASGLDDQTTDSGLRWRIAAIMMLMLLVAAAATIVVSHHLRRQFNSTTVAHIPLPGAYWPAVGDLNEDGIPDIVVSAYPGRVVSVVLGDGHGGATSVRGFEACEDARGIAVADFDGDGHQDVAVGCTAHPVVVLWGDGSGALSQPVDVPAAGIHEYVAAADLDGDGVADLIAANATEVEVLLARGRGFVLADRRAFPQRSLGVNLRIADFQDSTHYVIVSLGEEGSGNTVLLFASAGDGKLRPLAPMTLRSAAGPLAVADFNEDHQQDLAVCNWDGVELLFGSGGGQFRGQRRITRTEHEICYPVAADFDGDGHIDLALISTPGHTLDILRGTGHGDFIAGPHFEFDRSTTLVTTADLDSDSRPDLVVTFAYDRSLSVILNPYRKNRH